MGYTFTIVAPDVALGESEAAAIVCAAWFFLCTIPSVYNKILTKYDLYMEGGFLSAAFRGIGLALRASTIAAGHSTAVKSILSAFFAGAGFGMAISMQMLVIAGWLRNTASDAKPSFWKPLRLLMLCLLLPAIIVFGPIIGLTSALLLYARWPASQDHENRAIQMRQASAIGFLIITGFNFLVVLLCLYTSVRARGGFSLRKHASHTIVWLVPGTLLLVWASAFRVQGNLIRSWTLNSSHEALLFPLQTLPEMLQLILWCIPALMARIHLSDRFQAWWEKGHPDGPEVPPGGFATEQQPLPEVPSQLSIAAQAPDCEAVVDSIKDPKATNNLPSLSIS